MIGMSRLMMEGDATLVRAAWEATGANAEHCWVAMVVMERRERKDFMMVQVYASCVVKSKKWLICQDQDSKEMFLGSPPPFLIHFCRGRALFIYACPHTILHHA